MTTQKEQIDLSRFFPSQWLQDDYTLKASETDPEEEVKIQKVEIVETLPTVRNTVKGRLPEYLKLLFILSSMSYKTEDNKASYRILICNKSPNTSTAYDSFYLVLDTKNNYRGFADSELKACELAELIIKKP